jgi:hypothetical protein
MNTPAEAPNLGRADLLVWVAVAFLYFGISWDYIRTSWNDRKLHEYMVDVVQRGGAESKSQDLIHDLVLYKAQELSLPVHSEQVVVLGGGTSLSVSVVYEADIQIPVVDRGIYRKLYEHKVQYRAPR